MAFEFEAAVVDSDLTAERLSFADHPDDQQHYLIIQRDEESAADVLADMENVYVERDDQQFGGYGGIDSVSLTNTHLTLRLTPRMARQMGRHDTLSVRFPADAFHEVDAMVRQIYRGYESRVVRAK